MPLEDLPQEQFDRQVALRKLYLDEDRLKLDADRQRLDKRWLVRFFPVLLSAAISAAGVFLSCAQIKSARIAQISGDSARHQDKIRSTMEADRTWRLEILKFIATNASQIASPDSLMRNTFRAALAAALPDSLAYGVFDALAVGAPKSAGTTWSAARDTTARRLGTRIFVQFADEKDRSKVETLVADLKAAGLNAIGAELTGNQSSADVRYFYPQDSATATRVLQSADTSLARRGVQLVIVARQVRGFGDKVRPGTIELWLPKL